MFSGLGCTGLPRIPVPSSFTLNLMANTGNLYDHIYNIAFYVAVVVGLFLSLLAIILVGRYMTFKEMGIAPWKALIPFYGTWELLKITGEKKQFPFYILWLVCASLSDLPFVKILGIFGIVYITYKVRKRMVVGFGRKESEAVLYTLIGNLTYLFFGFSNWKLTHSFLEQCPNCQTEYQKGDLYCSKCGWDLSKQKEEEN